MEALAVGKEVRRIVSSAVKMRRYLQQRNLCRNHGLANPIIRLKCWLDSHPYPDRETVARFRSCILHNDLRAVMPHNKGGLSLLERFESLTNPLKR
jgi:hypothetical protein